MFSYLLKSSCSSVCIPHFGNHIFKDWSKHLIFSWGSEAQRDEFTYRRSSFSVSGKVSVVRGDKRENTGIKVLTVLTLERGPTLSSHRSPDISVELPWQSHFKPGS